MSERRALEWPGQDKGGPRHDALLAMVHASNRGEVRMGGGEGRGRAASCRRLEFIQSNNHTAFGVAATTLLYRFSLCRHRLLLCHVSDEHCDVVHLASPQLAQRKLAVLQGCEAQRVLVEVLIVCRQAGPCQVS